MVLRGTAGSALLDSYHAERQLVGERVVNRAWKSVGDMAPISEALGFRPGQSSDEGWASLEDLFAPGNDQAALREQLVEAIQLQNYQFNAHGMDMGQYYDSTAVIDGSAQPPGKNPDPDLYYTPTSAPGAQLPHAWVQRNSEIVSPLDLVGSGGFTLLTGVDDHPWRDAAARAAAELGIELTVEQVRVWCENNDVLNQWTQIREVSDSGALLVRPDRFIA